MGNSEEAKRLEMSELRLKWKLFDAIRSEWHKQVVK
jgi:hypothetical protein